VQWGMGLMIDGFKSLGMAEAQAFQSALTIFFMCCLASYAYFWKHRSDS
jgi:Mg2+ and Co2+ transporter CorA